jgi:hypothetical protein
MHYMVYLSRSDQPVLTTNNMRGNTDKFQITEFERRYWQKIHNLNEKEPPKPKPWPTPVGQYVLKIFEMINMEGRTWR